MPRGIFGENPIKCWDCNSSAEGQHQHYCPRSTSSTASVTPFVTVHRCGTGYAEAPQPLLPTDAKERKRIPLYSGLVKYFPDALIAVAALSQVGSDQHHPGQPLHWERDKSTDHEDTLLRHLLESGTVDTDGVRHSTKVAWRSLAKLQLELEKAKEGN